MLQTGNLTEILFSANLPTKELVVIAPPDWRDLLNKAFENCVHQFILIDLLDGVNHSIQQIRSDLSSENAAIIVVFPKELDLTRIVSGPCLNGIPIGLLPTNHPDELLPWIQAIQSTQDDTFKKNYHVLSMWKPFYIKWAKRFVSAISKGLDQKDRVKPLFADETSREMLCQALWSGPQLVLYVGHGRSRGWSGYRGLRWSHIAAGKQNFPVGSLLTLTCDNLKPGRDGIPAFGVRWVMEGRAAAFFGATEAVEIKPLKTIAKYFLTHFSSGTMANLGQLISTVDWDVQGCNDLAVKENWRKFRLIGNPLQPI